MTIRQNNIGGHVVTYDDETNALLGFDPTDDYKKRKEEATKVMLGRKEEFKQRGALVVKSEFQENWAGLVDNSLSETDLDQVWYNGSSIEAAIECMEKLSQGLPVEDAYKPIDIQDPETPCVHSGMELSGWQNNSITGVIGSYHTRGTEFCNYRNFTFNNYGSSKGK